MTSTADGRQILPPRPKLTRAQAWAEYEKRSKAAGAVVHPLMLGRARIAYELEIPPWVPADYLDEGEIPFADDRMIVDEIDACNAEAGRNIGGDSLWPMVKAKLLARGYRCKKKQVLCLMPKGTLGRPPHG
jgi:hypothetical protein